MAKTAKEMAVKTAAVSYDFSDKENDEVPRFQLRSYRMTPNAVTAANMRSAGESSMFDLTAGTRELSSTVTLPMPNELSQKSAFDWSIEDRSLLQDYIGNLNGDQSARDVSNNPAAAIMNMLIRGAASFDIIGARTTIQNAGFGINPLREIFFDGLSNRTFSWSWDLYPRNSSEAESIMKMIKKIRIDAHPEKFSTGLNIIPAEFEISWVNAKLPKIYKCVCTSFDADYADGGAARFFRDGFPSFMKLSASFTEIEILDRLTLEQDDW